MSGCRGVVIPSRTRYGLGRVADLSDDVGLRKIGFYACE
jgi:hypothetical protein